MKSILVITVTFIASLPMTAQAAQKQTIEDKVRTAPVTYSWQPILDLYTGSYYGVGLVNTMWQRAPRNKTVFEAAVKYRIPYRLLLGVWGIESGYGRAWNHFGLIGPATGNLRHDAFYAARLFDRFYLNRYHRHAV
jgi:membrane-bound lytic murein transglycosylase B